MHHNATLQPATSPENTSISALQLTKGYLIHGTRFDVSRPMFRYNSIYICYMFTIICYRVHYHSLYVRYYGIHKFHDTQVTGPHKILDTNREKGKL